MSYINLNVMLIITIFMNSECFTEFTVRYSLEFDSQSARNVFVIASTEGDIPNASGPIRGERIVDVRFVPKYSGHNTA